MKLRIVVAGYIGRYPLGGVAWDYVQYVVGLHRLGHDVYYIEDSGDWPYNPSKPALAADLTYNARHIHAVMERFGLEDRWAYVSPGDDAWRGMDSARVSEVMRTADLLINVSGSLRLEGLSHFHGRSVFIDSDPVFTQVKMIRGDYTPRLVAAHDAHFSFGETLVPGFLGSELPWRPTRQPVLLRDWANELPPGDAYRTVMNWSSAKPFVLQGRSYGQKDEELRRFLHLPGCVEPIQLQLAIAVDSTVANLPDRVPHEVLRSHGWRVADASVVAGDMESYAEFIKGSRGEWSVAKNAYVAGSPGWFSCRSACFLAAGRPVVVQDTGFSQVIPTGVGVLAFRDIASATEALREVERDWGRHSAAARQLAEEYFDADRVLTRLVDDAFAVHPAAGRSQ